MSGDWKQQWFERRPRSDFWDIFFPDWPEWYKWSNHPDEKEGTVDVNIMQEMAEMFNNVKKQTTEDAIIFTLALPGIPKDCIKIEAHDSMLHVDITPRKAMKEEDQDKFEMRDYQWPLPESAKLDEITSTYKDGLLTITVPIVAVMKVKIREISIQD